MEAVALQHHWEFGQVMYRMTCFLYVHNLLTSDPRHDIGSLLLT